MLLSLPRWLSLYVQSIKFKLISKRLQWEECHLMYEAPFCRFYLLIFPVKGDDFEFFPNNPRQCISGEIGSCRSRCGGRGAAACSTRFGQCPVRGLPGRSSDTGSYFEGSACFAYVVLQSLFRSPLYAFETSLLEWCLSLSFLSWTQIFHTAMPKSPWSPTDSWKLCVYLQQPLTL